MAGQVKVNQLQLGDSVTATQNFVLQTNVDGTAKLARGNVGATTQDILTVDVAGKVAFPQNVRTWQTVTRTTGTDYTNSTDHDIILSIIINATVATIGFLSANILVGGATICNFQTTQDGTGAGSIITVSAVIPAGAVYRWNDASNLARTTAIKELR